MLTGYLFLYTVFENFCKTQTIVLPLSYPIHVEKNGYHLKISI